MANSGRLSDEQMRQFHDDGCALVREPVLPFDSFSRLREHFERNSERCRGMPVRKGWTCRISSIPPTSCQWRDAV